MKHPFDQDNFEAFLSEQADSHRMYAEDRVWRNIQDNLHGRDRWPALTFASILTISIIAVALTLTYPNRELLNNPADYSAFTVATQSHNHPATNQANKNRVLAETVPTAVIGPVLTLHHASQNIKTDNLTITGETPVESLQDSDESLDAKSEQTIQSVENTAGLSESNRVNNTGTDLANEEIDAYNSSLIARSANLSYHNLVQLNNPEISVSAENRLRDLDLQQENLRKETFLKNSLNYGPRVPDKTITRARNNRWSFGLYITPSISYRYLLEDKKYVEDPNLINGPLAPYLTNSVNEFVNHQAKLGMEAGGTIIYQLADNFRVKTGLQLNYRQYGIKAFSTYAQPATLALNTDNGIDSITRYSSLSTQSGYREINLSSSFLQLAVPVGFDMKIADSRKVDFYVSASGQFTYQLASSYYLLSADYKNYLKQPDLDRKININTALEAFASFDAGGVTLQAGPQIRYQLLPGSINAYPIREHLIDYGFKLGVVKKLK